MSEIIVALIAGIMTLILAGIGIWGAKKYNIGPNQEKLVATLKDVVSAQEIRIKQLESQSADNAKMVQDLTLQVQRLTQLTIKQALKISELEKNGSG